MASFTYKAVSGDGKVTAGEITAGDRGEALRLLAKKSLQPISVKPVVAAVAGKKEKPAKAKPAARKKAKVAGAAKSKTASKGQIKLAKKDVVFFTEELSEMLAAGLQLEPALAAMEKREELGSLKELAVRLRQLVRDGSSFSQALQVVSPSFGPLYCNLAAAGEASGALPKILKRQAEYLSALQDLQGRVVTALIYPVILILAGIGVSVVMVTVLIPQLLTLMTNSGQGEIPLGARLLIGANNFIQQSGWLVLVILAVIAILFKAWKDKPENQPVWDENKLKIPGYGNVVKTRFYVQFLETMSNLVGNGLPLLRSLELTREATVNLYYKERLVGVIDEVGDGRAFSRSLKKSGLFPPVLIDMVSVGEQTGKLDESLERAATRFDKELDGALKKLMELVTPVVLVVMAVLIGSMMWLMVNAIFQTIKGLN